MCSSDCQKKYIPAIIIILLVSQIHATALIFLPVIFIATGRGSDTRFDFFDDEFHHLDLKHGHKNADTLIEKPSQFGLMKRIASKLSEGLPQVRVDLYEINGRVFFGEYTFFHWGGTIPFDPESWDAVFGESIKLPMK